MPQACRLTLPIPPSVNQAYVNVPKRGRVASKELKEWKAAAGWQIKTQPRAQFAGPFTIRLLLPKDMRGDVDNRLKPVLDLLVSLSITPDDRFAKSVSSERFPDIAPNECVVIVESAK